MRPFDLEEYQKLINNNEEVPLITREYLPVRIVCIDRQHVKYSIIALVMKSPGFESIKCYTSSGHYEDSKTIHNNDLFFVE